MLSQGKLAVLRLEGVDVDRAVRGLGNDVFIEGIPSHALDVVVMFGDLSNTGSCLGVVDAGNVVHAAGDEEDAVRRPGKVVDLGPHRPAHVLDPPCLLIFEAFFKIGVCCVVFGGHPEEDVAVVAGAGERFSSWTPSDNIHGLRVFYEGGQICNLAFFARYFYFPEADIVISAGSCQSTFSMGLEVGRVDGCIVVVPGHKQWSSLHGEGCCCGGSGRR